MKKANYLIISQTILSILRLVGAPLRRCFSSKICQICGIFTTFFTYTPLKIPNDDIGQPIYCNNQYKKCK